ncbi:hypothetical protein BGZ46_002595 [Entomortierella lignicola]|nr:hypothetical protein BGZ46_002595 [Entomortierella lignicola]
MSASELGQSDAKQQARLDAFIDSLADHRQYHSNLVSDLKELLSSQTPASHSQLHKTKDPNAEILGKQIKRLFNQSLSTLTKWSEILEAPSPANVDPRDKLNITATSSRSDTATRNSSGDISETQRKMTQTITISTAPVSTSSIAATIIKSHPVPVITGASSIERTQSRSTENRETQKNALQKRSSSKNLETVHSMAEPRPTRTSRLKGATVTAIARQSTTKAETSTSVTVTSVSVKDDKSVYDTDGPTYAHIAVLVDVSFLGVRTLELMGKCIYTNLFEIEKARSNLISKIIQLGMALSKFITESTSSTSNIANGGLEQALTFIRLVLALHNNAIRCWMDVRNGSLAFSQAGQQALDALFRLLFIAAGRAVNINPTRDEYRHAFTLRMHGIKYHGAYLHLTEAKDNMIWDKILRCGAEFEKSTRDGQTQDDILLLLRSYMTMFRFLSEFTTVDLSNPRFLEWRNHFSYYSGKVDDTTIHNFMKELHCNGQDMNILDTAAPVTGYHHSPNTPHEISQPKKVQTTAVSVPITNSVIKPAVSDNLISTGKAINRLDDTVLALRKFEDSLQYWRTLTSPGQDHDSDLNKTKDLLSALERDIKSFPTKDMPTPIIQNIARIFRSLDSIRSIGSKIMDKYEKEQNAMNSNAAEDRVSMDLILHSLISAGVVTKALSDLVVGLWRYARPSYLALHAKDNKAVPDPTKLSCARVDAILFLFRLYQSNISSTHLLNSSSILEYLESALSTAKEMDDSESLPWISNALYNFGGVLFKTDRREEAIRPLEVAIECYLHWLRDDLATDTSLHSSDTTKNTKTEARLILANRYEVLGVCFQAIDDLDHALNCFNSGLCVLPLSSFRDIDTVMLGELKTSQLPAAKLLNRRVRVLLMMEEPRFVSLVTAVPEFEARVTGRDVPAYIQGIVQEFECRILSVLSVKTNQITQRNSEQIEILKHLMAKVYRGGRSLTNPIRRARILIQLAVLFQGHSDTDLQQEAIHLIEEAIEILKERDLKADFELEPIRNHNLALAYSWNGILDRNRGDGLSRKSKPFQIALQLWETILSDIECFVSHEDAQLLHHQSKIQSIKRLLPEPEMLYDHLQMLADCLGMIDYRVLQVQVYLLMLRLCNGVLTMSEETCAGQAYLALGYSGKAKIALNHGKLILEEMGRVSKDSSLQGEVYATWLLVYSLYLTSVGHKAQGVSAYNQAKQYSDRHQAFIRAREGTIGPLSKGGVLSRKVEARVYKAIIIVEASLARSQLLFYEGNLSEAISDSKRAGRQLSRIVSTLSAAIKAAQSDPAIVNPLPMDNPFLVQEKTAKQLETQTQEQVWSENRQLRQGLEILATQRFQWSIFRLLIEAYHQLGRLYLIQGCAREAEYFFQEGKYIANLSKAGKSLDRFMLDQAELQLRQHEWQGCQQLLEELSMQENESNTGALSLEIQDARIQLLRGDLYFETNQLDLSLQAYYRTDEVLSHLMDKSFISGLEKLVIREPQTPREAKLFTTGRHQGAVDPGMLRWQPESSLEYRSLDTPDQAQFECVTLGGIKATMGYRIGLLFGLDGRRVQAYGMIEGSKAEDPSAFTIAEYHITKAKVLILEIEDAMAKHLTYAMIPESALSVGLFRKTRTLKLASPPKSFLQSLKLNDNGIQPQLHSHLSSPSVRVTRMTRRRRSRLANESLLQSPTRARVGAPQALGKNQINQYQQTLRQAREHLTAAYKHSIQIYSPHVVSEICSRQAYLSILESCFHQEVIQEKATGIREEIDNRGDSRQAMANRAACYLEMAKAVTQHREMHGLIKQKLDPDSPQEDQSWPRDIQIKGQRVQSDQSQRFQTSLSKGPYLQRVGSKTVNIIGLEKPRRLMLLENTDDGQEMETDTHLLMEEDEDMDLQQVGMKPEDLSSRRGKREYFNRQSQLRPSTSLGNERNFLEVMDKIYERDTRLMDERPEAFQQEFVDILPEHWTVVSLSMDVEHEVLYVNRMRANAIPLVVRLPLNRAQLREGDGQALGLISGLIFDEEDELELEQGQSLSFKEAVEELKDILRASQETLALTSSKHLGTTAGPTGLTGLARPPELSREAKAAWWNQRQELDDRLCALLGCMEDQWLCGLKGLVQSHNTPAIDKNLIEFKKTLEWIMSEAVNSMPSAQSISRTRGAGQRSSDSRKESLVQLEINIDLCRVILHLGDQPTKSELKDLIYFLLDAYLYKNMSSTASSASISAESSIPPIVEYSEVQFGRIAKQIKEALCCYWEAETAAKNNGFDKGAHVILILDKHLQMFPWESCPALRNEAVSRIPSMWLLRDRILKQRWRQSKTDPFDSFSESLISMTTSSNEAMPTWDSKWQDLEIDPRKTSYILNPGGDLKNTEDEFRGYVENQQGWDGVIGRAPSDLEFIDGLSKNDLFIYFGHSGGEQYVKSAQIRQLGQCAVSLLLGCSSGSLKSEGEFDPTGNAMNYLLAGCPAVVANLWDVTDKDLDRFSMGTFSLWGLESKSDDSEMLDEDHLRSGYIDNNIEEIDRMDVSNIEYEQTDSGNRLRLSLVEAVKDAREECKLKYLVGAASVVYGIPCYLKRSNNNNK